MPCVEARVLAVRSLGPDGVVITVASDSHGSLRPFQFYMLSVPSDPAFPFLPRPFSVYDARPGSLDFLIKEVGPGTRSLARCAVGGSIRIAGPLGNDVRALPDDRRAIGVAGGVGIAPFLLLYREWAAGRVTGARAKSAQKPLLLFGARTAGQLYDLDLFRSLPIEVRVSTEDGSVGIKGRVTALLDAALDEGPGDVVCCGPDPMMEAVAALCAKRATPCRLSLETFMGCGYGVCNACAVKVKDPKMPKGYRYDRCCVDGPVFDALALAH